MSKTDGKAVISTNYDNIIEGSVTLETCSKFTGDLSVSTRAVPENLASMLELVSKIDESALNAALGEHLKRPKKHYENLDRLTGRVPAEDSQETRIVPPPGALVARILPLLRGTDMGRTLSQSLADMRFEHFEALKAGDVKLARWMHARWVLWLIWAVVFQAGASLLKKLFDMWKLGGGD